jgi:hypothetical protein
MTNRFTTLAAAAALLIGLSAPAMAVEITLLQTIGHWKVRTVDKLCIATGEFKDGTLLEFVINAKGALLVSVDNQNWSIPEGHDYEVVMQVDRAEAKTFRAAANKTYVYWQMPMTEASVNLLSYGRTLRAQIGKVAVTYDLALSEPALKAVFRCAAPHLDAANPFSNASPPAQSQPANPFVETPSNPYRRM